MEEWDSQGIGKTAEDLACLYLMKQGLRLLKRNYQCRLGEIDLIMQEGMKVIFIEVRYRRDRQHGSSLESIGYFKKNRIIKTALFYLSQKKMLDKVACRFDVVALEGVASPQIQWLKNAFQAD